MNRKHSPIQKKLMAVIMMTSGIVLVMTCAAFFVFEFFSAREITRRHVSTIAKVVASNSTAALMFNSKEDATETLNSLYAEEHIIAASLFDTSGNIFAKYPKQLPDNQLPSEPFHYKYQFEDDYIHGFEPVMIDGKTVGILYLRSDMNEMYTRFKLYAIIAIIFMLISFLFAYFVSKRLQKTISSPILDLADVARVVSEQGNYSVRALKASEDEVGELTDAFNHMLTRIGIQNEEITTLNQNLEQKVKERTRELEEAMHKLSKQTEFSEKILDSTVDLIAVFDTDLKYVTMNKQSEQMYKTSRDEIRGKYIADVFPQVLESGMIGDLNKAKEGVIIRNLNYRSVITNRVYENFYVPLRDENDHVYGIMTVAHDITDIIRANEKLQQLNAELEKSNRELEQFAYVASHDLQEPLRKIQTFSELSERSLHNEEALKKYLGKVNSSAQRMTELIKAVLNYSKLAEKENIFVDVDLNNILERIFIDLELLIEEKKAVITYDPLPAIPGNPLQLHQLFLNLITNSLKFNDRQPLINITSKTGKGKNLLHASSLDDSTNYLMLEFSDNGIGFEQKFSNKIFSIFQRLHNDRNFAGTGIGLALCKKIVDNHEGVIAVESEPGKGTTFYIYFPVVNAKRDQLTNTSSTKK